MPTVGDQRVEMTAGPGIKKNVAHCFYLIVIFASFGYLKDFDCDEFLLVSSFPDFRRNTGLLGYSIVSRNRLEDEGCWQDPITTTDLAEMRKCPALQFNAKLFVRIQDLEAKTVGLDFVGNNTEGGLFYARDDIDELLGSLLGRNPSYARQLIVQALFHHRRSGHEDRKGRRVVKSHGVFGERAHPPSCLIGRVK